MRLRVTRTFHVQPEDVMRLLGSEPSNDEIGRAIMIFVGPREDDSVLGLESAVLRVRRYMDRERKEMDARRVRRVRAAMAKAATLLSMEACGVDDQKDPLDESYDDERAGDLYKSACDFIGNDMDAIDLATAAVEYVLDEEFCGANVAAAAHALVMSGWDPGRGWLDNDKEQP